MTPDAGEPTIEVLRWCVDDPGEVPAWVTTITGKRTREEIVKKWGPGARFAEPASQFHLEREANR